MALSLSPDDRYRILRQLSHGAELARSRHGDRATHHRVIWALIEEAVDVLDRLPDQDRRWLTSGTRSGGWNMVGLSDVEAADLERIRILCAMKPYDGQAGYTPQRDDTDRAVDVMGWLRWCAPKDDTASEKSRRLVKAAVALARGGDTEAVHRIYDPKGKRYHRQMIHEIRKRCADLVLRGLREDCNIIPGSGLSFEETYP